jgi:TatA/E family protein of Tat protein translocase
MGPIGMTEMVVILVIALVIFGPRKLPELGRSLGRSLNEFKRASNELKSTLEDEIRVEDQKEQRAKMEAEQQSAVAAAQPQASSTPPSASADTQPSNDTHTVSPITPA